MKFPGEYGSILEVTLEEGMFTFTSDAEKLPTPRGTALTPYQVEYMIIQLSKMLKG